MAEQCTRLPMRAWLGHRVVLMQRPASVTRRIQRASRSGRSHPTSYRQGFCLRIGRRVLIVTTGL